MADDIALALKDTLQFPCVRTLMSIHERASGALNNWSKTFGLRIGSLAGTNVLPPAWDPKHIIFSSDPVRYLGILLGIPEKVATAWCAECPHRCTWCSQTGSHLDCAPLF
jgi:hypothetical protein